MADCAWRGYDPRAMVPGLAVAAVISALLVSGRWYLDDLSRFADRVGALAVYAMALAVWPGLIVVLVYRCVTYTYRLTDRAVLIDRGFRFRPEPHVLLADLTGVTSGCSWLGRRLGVGWVQLAIGGRVVKLSGVRNPAAFAEAIRAAAAGKPDTP